jgi:hypothetical protein
LDFEQEISNNLNFDIAKQQEKGGLYMYSGTKIPEKK